MRIWKFFRIALVAGFLVFGLFAKPSLAGCCQVGNICYSDSELGYPDIMPTNECIARGGTYSSSCTCPTNNSGSTSSRDENAIACCKYQPGNCLNPYASGMCPQISGLPTPQYEAKPCNELPYCTGLGSETKPEISATDESVVFRPQITLPGSKFVAGESITVTGSTLGEYIAAFYAFFVGAIAILATVMIFYGGVMWLMAGGNRGQVQNAKEQISSALIGLGIAFLAYLLLLTLSPRLVKFSSLNLKFVKPVEQVIVGAEVAFGFKGTPPSTATLTQTWVDEMKTKYDSQISGLANSAVPRDLIYAIIYVESGGRPDVISSAGACGIMQLLPTTAGKSCTELLNPQIGIQAGVNYLQTLAAQTCPTQATKRDGTVVQCNPVRTSCRNGDQYYMAAAYNGGQGANCDSRETSCPGRTWWECQVNTGYQETRNYVIKVQQARDKLRCFLNNQSYPC
ncbi:lytic transglycosylase domain-containing protein [Candidatus Parcubacteria bacterium]|jgi:hypothetical protein|nr:MAG: lytic transglycosylase domain-containing protein [Candidatus Parcubacteria bacterium]